MNKQHCFLLFIYGLVMSAALALWPAYSTPRAYANVTLVSFTATSLTGQPEIYLEWETATEFDTVGFFIVRSDSATGTFTRISDFIPHEGDTIVGAQYDHIDENAVLGNTYWYKLEELTTNQESQFYGPISAMSGVPATATSTPTRTPTATLTRTPTATPTPTATSAAQTNPVIVNPTSSSNGNVVVTPRVITGATVTPRATSVSGSSSPTAAATQPVNVPDAAQQPQAVATAMSSVPDAAAVTVAPPPSGPVEVAQAANPTLVPADTVPAMVAPVVVVTEAAPAPAATGSANSPALLLVGAAFLFLGIAFVILRQARS